MLRAALTCRLLATSTALRSKPTRPTKSLRVRSPAQEASLRLELRVPHRLPPLPPRPRRALQVSSKSTFSQWWAFLHSCVESHSLLRCCASFCRRWLHRRFFTCLHRPNWHRLCVFHLCDTLHGRRARFVLSDLHGTCYALSDSDCSGKEMVQSMAP